MIKMWVLVVFLAAGAVEVHPQPTERACRAAAVEQERIEATRTTSDVVAVLCLHADVEPDLSLEFEGGLAP